jgi:hypothetical protein
VFIPCTGQIHPVGRVEGVEVPPAELAIIVHNGPHDNIDLAYGARAGRGRAHPRVLPVRPP